MIHWFLLLIQLSLANPDLLNPKPKLYDFFLSNSKLLQSVVKLLGLNSSEFTYHSQNKKVQYFICFTKLNFVRLYHCQIWYVYIDCYHWLTIPNLYKAIAVMSALISRAIMVVKIHRDPATVMINFQVSCSTVSRTLKCRLRSLYRLRDFATQICGNLK